ncbi:phospholipid-binding protein [Stappia sp.]|jgi:phosphatidylethanolamine-binding protein (PEBP) family uncharacterized protein|uniref:phospholipid-binding protein n=1 Tax=Stappia sp. TaxID=1870903 RepID=UPI003D0B30D4
MRILLAAIAFVCSVSAASAMSMSFTWGPTAKCFDSKSPPISLSKVPKGTVKLRFKMVDLNAINYNHGGGTVGYAGKNKLPYGAFRYRGPCPPTRHTYEIRVEALDSAGKVLANAKGRRAFP